MLVVLSVMESVYVNNEKEYFIPLVILLQTSRHRGHHLVSRKAVIRHFMHRPQVYGLSPPGLGALIDDAARVGLIQERKPDSLSLRAGVRYVLPTRDGPWKRYKAERRGLKSLDFQNGVMMHRTIYVTEDVAALVRYLNACHLEGKFDISRGKAESAVRLAFQLCHTKASRRHRAHPSSTVDQSAQKAKTARKTVNAAEVIEAAVVQGAVRCLPYDKLTLIGGAHYICPDGDSFLVYNHPTLLSYTPRLGPQPSVPSRIPAPRPLEELKPDLAPGFNHSEGRFVIRLTENFACFVPLVRYLQSRGSKDEQVLVKQVVAHFLNEDRGVYEDRHDIEEMIDQAVQQAVVKEDEGYVKLHKKATYFFD